MMFSIFWGLVLACACIAIAFYLDYFFRLRFSGRLLRGVGRLALSLILVVLVVTLASAINALWATLLLSLLMVFVASLLAVVHGKLKARSMLLPIFAGMAVATLIMSPIMALWVTSVKDSFSAHIFLPLVGFLTGSMSGVLSKSLRVYYMGLEHHRQLYDYLLGNGCTHRRAMDYFIRRALQSVCSSLLRRYGAASAFLLPVCTYALVLSGWDVLSSAVFEFALCMSILAASLLSLIVALLVSRRMLFDDYGRFQPVP